MYCTVKHAMESVMGLKDMGLAGAREFSARVGPIKSILLQVPGIEPEFPRPQRGVLTVIRYLYKKIFSQSNKWIWLLKMIKNDVIYPRTQ
jgi:hypothetical protein